MITWYEQLRDPRWQKKRLHILEQHKFQCVDCGSTLKTLHVHHLIYKKKKAPWEYEDCELTVLCEDCHKKCHKNIDQLNQAIDLMKVYSVGSEIDLTLGFVKGLLWYAGVDVTIDNYEQAWGFGLRFNQLPEEVIKQFELSRKNHGTTTKK